MKKKLAITAMLMFALTGLFAQGFLNKLKRKAQDVADRTVDKVTDKRTVPDAPEKTAEPVKANPSAALPNMDVALSSNSNFDFIPGQKILLEENFEQDVLGEFPLKWYTRSKAEVVTLNEIKGKWLRLYPGTFVSPVVSLKENTTIEFDMIMNFPLNGGYLIPSLSIGLYDRGDKGYILSYDYLLKNQISLTIGPYRTDAFTRLSSFENAKKKFESDKYKVSDFDRKAGKPVHVSVSIQKERIRIWLDKEKIFDIPQAVPLNGNLNQLKFDMAPSNYKNDQLGYYISNLKLAEGVEDARSKLLTSGKLETNGILFATNSAEIKSDGEGVIQEVAAVLTENPEMNIKIVGHTDTDGTAEANLVLSKKRAESVRAILIKDHKIMSSRIETEGKGASETLSDDKSPEAKAKNRRVEFIKI